MKNPTTPKRIILLRSFRLTAQMIPGPSRLPREQQKTAADQAAVLMPSDGTFRKRFSVSD